MDSLTFLVVDDSPDFLAAACELLEKDSRLKVIGTAGNGEEALALARQLRPEVVLMDLNMPVMNGLEAARQIKADPNGPTVILMSIHDDPIFRAEAAKVGADGFIPKSDFGNAVATMISSLVGPRKQPDNFP